LIHCANWLTEDTVCDARRRGGAVGGARRPGRYPAGRSASYTGGGESASFKYDAFGRRIEATVNGQTTYYLYGASDGGHPIAENAGGAWYREAIMEGVRWGWLYQNGDGRFTLPDALGPTARTAWLAARLGWRNYS